MERVFRPRFFYGWVVVAAGFINFMVGAGRLQSFGVFYTELQAEFGWSAAAISSIQSVNTAAYILTPMIGAWCMNRWGPRRVIFVAAPLLGVSTSLLSIAHSLPQFYLFYFMAGLAGVMLPITMSYPQRWFTTRRGLVLGIAISGASLGGLLYPPYADWLVTTFDWRTAYLIMGIVDGLLLILVGILLVPSPEDMGLRPYGEKENPPAVQSVAPGAPARRRAAPAWTTRKALRSWAFPLLLLGGFVISLSGSMVSVHLIPFVTKLGISRAIAATALGVGNGLGIPSRIGIGALSPGVMGWKRSLVLWSALTAATMFWLAPTKNLWMVWTFVISRGVFMAGMGPQVPGIIGAYYGRDALLSLVAMLNSITMIGTTLGPVVAGVLYDKAGSYFVAFLVAAILAAVGSFLYLLLKPPRVGAASGASAAA